MPKRKPLASQRPDQDSRAAAPREATHNALPAALSLSGAERNGLLAVLLVSLICIIIVIFGHHAGDYGVETDLYLFYAPTAQALHHGQILIDDFHPPLYGWVLGVLTMTGIFPGEFEAALLVSVLSFLVVVGMTYLIAKELVAANRDIPLVAALLVAVNPTLLDMSFRANVHIFFLAVSLASIYTALKKEGILTGLLVAAAIWTRYTWILSIVPIFFLRKRALIEAAAIALAAYIGLGIVTSVYKGGWYQSINNVSFASGLYNLDHPENIGRWDEEHMAEFKNKGLIAILLYNPKIAIQSVWQHLHEFSGQILTMLLTFPIGLFAITGLRRKYWKDWRNPLIFWTGMAFVILIFSFWGPQYSIGFVPLFSLAAAVQLVHLPWPKFNRWIGRTAILWAAGMGIVFSLLAKPTSGPTLIKQVGLCLKTLPGSTVVARDPRVFYYSGKTQALLKTATDGTITTNGDYVLVNNYEVVSSDVLRTLVNSQAQLKNYQSVSGNSYECGCLGQGTGVTLLRMRPPSPPGQPPASSATGG
jgi:hypothetical protein